MAINATDNGGTEFAPAPEGTHLARCTQVIDLGTLFSKYYGKWSHKVLLGWELCNELKERDDGESGDPHLVWNQYSLSLHQNANLRRDLESWRGRAFTADELRGFDISALLGVPCMLSLVHSDGDGGKVYANVQAVMALPKGTEVPAQMTETKLYEIALHDDPAHKAVFDTFNDNLQLKILSSQELGGHTADQDAAVNKDPEPSNEVPF